MKELRLAFSLLSMNRWRILVAVLMGSTTLLAAVGLAGLSAWLIGRTWQQPEVAAITGAVTMVRALGVSRGFFRYMDRVASHNVALKGLVNVREKLYLRLAEGDPSVILRMRKGDFLARLGSDVDDVGDLIVRAIIPACIALVLDTVTVVWMFLMSPWAGLVMLVALILSGVVVPWLSVRAATAAEEAHAEADHDVYADVVTVMDHAPELAVAGRLATVIDSAEHAGKRSLEEEDRTATPNALASALGPVATWVSVLACLLVGIIAYSLNGDGMVFEDTTAFQPTTLLMMVLLPLAAFEASDALPTAAVQYVRSCASLRRLRELLTPARRTSGIPVPSTVPDAAPASPAGAAHGGVVMEVSGLVPGWGEELVAPVTATLHQGDRLVIVGPSGVGKTTLLSTMAGLLPPLRGTVTLNGVAVTEAEEMSLRQMVGVFPEDAHIFDTTVLENLRVVAGDVSEAEATDALTRAGLGEWLGHLPHGVNTHLVGGAEALSGGERRRLLLARAMVARRPITLIDEPTEHLDAADVGTMLHRIVAPDDIFAQDQIVVVVTHVLPDQLDEAVTVLQLEPTEPRRILLV